MAIITLTTDFGPSSPYVGLMKGVILSIAPDATLVDYTHDVPAHDVLAASVMLESLMHYFPEETIHVVVVDPGVGSQRDAVAIRGGRGVRDIRGGRGGEHVWVGPDNGLFTTVINDSNTASQAVRLTNPRYHRHPVSTTFHGRDVFAPVAAHLVLGVPLENLGEPVDCLVKLDLPHPVESQDGSGLYLHVAYVDRFGNLVTDLTVERWTHWLSGRDPNHIELAMGDVVTLYGLKHTFSDVAIGQWLMYLGSGGRLEVAIREGNAAETIHARTQQPKCLLRWRST